MVDAGGSKLFDEVHMHRGGVARAVKVSEAVDQQRGAGDVVGRGLGKTVVVVDAGSACASGEGGDEVTGEERKAKRYRMSNLTILSTVME